MRFVCALGNQGAGEPKTIRLLFYQSHFFVAVDQLLWRVAHFGSKLVEIRFEFADSVAGVTVPKSIWNTSHASFFSQRDQLLRIGLTVPPNITFQMIERLQPFFSSFVDRYGAAFPFLCNKETNNFEQPLQILFCKGGDEIFCKWRFYQVEGVRLLLWA